MCIFIKKYLIKKILCKKRIFPYKKKYLYTYIIFYIIKKKYLYTYIIFYIIKKNIYMKKNYIHTYIYVHKNIFISKNKKKI